MDNLTPCLCECLCVFKCLQELGCPRWGAGCCCRPVRLGGCCWLWQRQESSSRCELSSLAFGSLAALPLAPNTAVTWPTEQGCAVVCLCMRAKILYINPQQLVWITEHTIQQSNSYEHTLLAMFKPRDHFTYRYALLHICITSNATYKPLVEYRHSVSIVFECLKKI